MESPRMLFRHRLLAVVALLAALPVFAQGYPNARPTDNPTALDAYMAKPDPNYKWELVRTDEGEGVTSYTINLTSQQWRTKAEVDRPLWQHWLTITVPDQIDYPSAMLYIDGGSNRKGGNPPGADGDFEAMARRTNTVTASIRMVPNQPLVFADAFGWGRSEDAMIAYTWDKFFNTGDPEWLARMPMTKAVVRAMDTLQTFCASEAGGGHTIENFVVAGGSKRGWTTWTTAIVDKRVIAIAPCVIDLLNTVESFHHHWQSYGRWSAAVGDYLANGAIYWLDTPEFQALLDIVDPYSYLDRLTMPKFIMNGANDQFFVPDSSQYYWDDLQGPKWLRYVPNAGHPLDDTAVPSVGAFYHAVVAGLPIPNYSFHFEDDGTIVAELQPSSDGTTVGPESVKLWQAYNPKTRDVRGVTATYEATDLSPTAPGVYRANVQPKDEGYTFYFIELNYPGPHKDTPFRFTTGVRVTPQEMPFPYTPHDPQPKGFITGK
ncbi:MAG: PhoPQ-activated pathogenicity [Candidatus Hydrogenedens sp.]|nr:PhoPQ-activated pathogenicity [Candidatus Hydrogenedens sp.]